MPYCAVSNCKNRSTKVNRSKGGISFHGFPKDPETKAKWIDATGLKDWFPNKNSTICSAHFKKENYTITNKWRRLFLNAYPTVKVWKSETKISAEAPMSQNIVEEPQQTRKRKSEIKIDNELDGRDTSPLGRVLEDSRSVTPITDPEDEESEMVPPNDGNDYSIVIQDPLSHSSDQGSFKQLYSHQPGAGQTQLYMQPSTSTSEPVIKEEIDEEFLDYKAMYFKLLEEVAALKKQQLYQENQALIETNKNMGKEMENLIETNQKYAIDMQQLMSENQRLIEKNQSLAENIQYLSDKIQELTAKNENRTRERVDIFSDYIEKIENLNEKIRSLTEDNKSLTEKNKTLAESVRKYSQERRSFEVKNKLQRRFILRLKNSFNNNLEAKSRVIKALRQRLIKLKAGGT